MLKGSSKIEFVTKEELLNDYQHLTEEQIGQQYNVSSHTIRNRMKYLGIPTRAANETRRLVRNFFHVSKDELISLYKNLTCEKIAKKYNVGETTVSRRMQEFDIPRRHNQDGHGWTWKGKKYSGSGYIYILLSLGDPMYSMANKKRGYVPEHRLVMARYLGRCLLKSEVVHHKNGIRDDNRLENLELFSPGKHSVLSNICHRCELRKEIRLLRWQIKQLQETLQYKMSMESK